MILSIFLIIVVIAVALWGGLYLFRLIPSFWGSSTPTLSITAPLTEVDPDTRISLSWEYPDTESGVFSFQYGCTPNASLEAPVAEGGVFGAITCGVPYGVPSTERAITLIGKNTGTTRADIPVLIQYSDGNGNIVASATSTLHITSGPTTTEEPAETPTTTTNTTPTTPTTPPAGTPDLMVKNLYVATIDPYTGTVELHFEVQNIGTGASGPWSFVATLPTSPNYRYQSPEQRSLGSQDGIVFTLRFDRVLGGTITIDVDEANRVRESNEYNNTASTIVSGSTYNYAPSTPDYYYPDQYYTPQYYTPTYNPGPYYPTTDPYCQTDQYGQTYCQ